MAPVKTFLQRTALLDSIREQLCRAQVETQHTQVGVWGMGGAGMSQLALSYLQRYRDEYNATFWIHADQSSSIDSNILGIYQLLSTGTREQSNTTPESVRKTVLSRSNGMHGKWLMVFDGADGLEENDRNFVDLSQYIPGCPGVHVIITSRLSAAEELSTVEGVHVGELEECEATDLLFQCSKVPKTQEGAEEEVKAITKELGYLALAIEIAGMYVSQTPRLLANLSAYLTELRQSRHELLKNQPHRLISRYSESVMTVWETSYVAVHD